eukprot:1157711-Pelagomonas_calceolata.AAC.16
MEPAGTLSLLGSLTLPSLLPVLAPPSLRWECSSKEGCAEGVCRLCADPGPTKHTHRAWGGGLQVRGMFEGYSLRGACSCSEGYSAQNAGHLSMR